MAALARSRLLKIETIVGIKIDERAMTAIVIAPYEQKEYSKAIARRKARASSHIGQNPDYSHRRQGSMSLCLAR